MTNYRWRIIFSAAMFVLVIFGLAMSGCGGDQEQAEKQDVQQEAQDTALSVKEYIGEKKDEVLGQAGAALDKAEEQIEELSASIEAKWERMDAAARERANKTLDALKEKRQALADDINDMKDTSADALGKMQEGFWDGYESLKDSLDDARQDIERI